MPPAVLPPSLFSRRALLGSPAEHHPLGWGGAELWAGSGRFWCDGPAAAPVSGRRRPEEYRGPAGEGGPSQGILPPSPGPSGQVRDLCLVPLLQASDQKNVSAPGLPPGSERRFQPELGQAERRIDPGLPLCWVTQ